MLLKKKNKVSIALKKLNQKKVKRITIKKMMVSMNLMSNQTARQKRYKYKAIFNKHLQSKE